MGTTRQVKENGSGRGVDSAGCGVDSDNPGSTVTSATETVREFESTIVRQMTLEQQLALEACLRCGQCGKACSWYQETGEEQRHPLYRKEFVGRVYRQAGTWVGKASRRLGVVKALEEQELDAHMESFWKCTGCGRCTLACPLGLSNRSVFRLARSAYAACKMSERNPTRRSIIENTKQSNNSFGLTPEQTLLRLAFHLAIERTDVPLDRLDAEYLLVVPTVDVMRFPEELFRLFQVLNAANVNYTLSSQVTDLGTEIDHVIVDHEQSVRMLTRVEGGGSSFRCKLALGSRMRLRREDVLCGRPRDLRSFVGGASDVGGHGSARGDIARGSSRWRRYDRKITLHDPCQVTRLSGMGPLVRRLLTMFAPDFIEMSPNGPNNYCCNGSSGPLRLPENTELRRRVSRLKADQIARTGGRRRCQSLRRVLRHAQTISVSFTGCPRQGNAKLTCSTSFCTKPLNSA